MYTEARKIHLIEEVLKVTNEDVLIELEDLLKDSKTKINLKNKKHSIYDFVAFIKKSEAKEMRISINETCENINADDWK